MSAVVIFLTAGDLLRPRSLRPCGRCPVLAECGESARQAASEDTYPFLERAGQAFGSTPAPRVLGQKSTGLTTLRPGQRYRGRGCRGQLGPGLVAHDQQPGDRFGPRREGDAGQPLIEHALRGGSISQVCSRGGKICPVGPVQPVKSASSRRLPATATARYRA
jgi:hypothetical protein